MSVTLGLDTATDTASVAVGDSAGLRAQIAIGRRRHAATVTRAITNVLAMADATVTDVDAIVLGDGPGSFTGLRIGAATVQGLVRAHERIDVHVAPSLMAAAWVGAPFVDGVVGAWYDALRGEVFAGAWSFAASEITTLLAPMRGTPADVQRALTDPPAIVVGDGAVLYAAAVRAWVGREPVGPPSEAYRAAGLLHAHRMGATQLVPDPFQFVPAYGRAAEAQVRWESTHGQPLPDPPGRLI